jgi:PAS domain S-box-containing protein
LTGKKPTTSSRQVNERYEAFIRNSSEGIWLFELEKPVAISDTTKKQVAHFFKYAYLAEANNATAKMYGFRSTKKMIGMRLGEFMIESDPENIAYLTAFIENNYNLSGVESHELDIKGNDKYFRNSLVGVLEDGKIVRAWGTQQDVTSQRKAIQELERSRERLDLALQATAMGIWEWDVVNNELYWSPELKKLFGVKVKDTITYEKYQTLLHPDDREHMLEVIQDSMTNGSTYQVEHRIIWPDGSVHWRLGLGKAHFENGKVIRMVGTSMDIDARKRDEIALHRQNAYLEALHTTAKETFEGMDRSSRVLENIIKYAREISRTSDAYLYLLSSKPNEMIVKVGTGIFSEHVGHTIQKGEGLAGKVWSTGKPIVIDSYDNWKGRQSNFPKGLFKAIVGIPLFSDNTVIGVLAFAQQKPHKKFDVQQVIALSRLADLASISLKNSHLFQKVQESERRFRGMADSAPVMIWLADPDKRRTYFNASWLKFTGSTLKRELGNGWYRHAHKDDAERYRNIYETSFEKRIHFNVEYRLRRKDGAYRWVLSTASPRFSPDGEFLGYIGSCIDIHDVKQASELKLANTQLKNQRSQLLALNRAKNDFVALASHQLRTPATAVKQYLGLLANEFAGKLNPQQKKYANVAYESNERQLKIINDLLRTAQIESGRFQLEKRRHDMAVVLREAIKEMTTTFEMRRQKVKLAGFEPVTVSIDAAEMNLVLNNLLENASKYSHPDSEIHVSMRRSGGKLEIIVKDFGVGIGAHDKQRIFDKFTRIDNELSDTVAGTGLGLYWVKRIILLHGGTITVHSEPGEGSSFIVRLPL